MPLDFSKEWLFVTFVSLILFGPLPAVGADKAPPKKTPTPKTKVDKTKKNTPESRLAAEFERLFKSWDADKDANVTEDELKKFYRIRPPKPKKGAPPVDAELPKPLLSLTEKLDTDQDQKISSDEFAAWAPGFAAHLIQVSQIQSRIAQLQQSIAETEAIMGRGGKVSALDGAANDLLRRGVIRYQLDIKSLQGQLEKLEADAGYGEYREFIQQSLLRRMK